MYDGWREGLEQAQIELVDGDDADVVVAPASLAREAAAVAPHGLIVEGAPRPGTRWKRDFSTGVWNGLALAPRCTPRRCSAAARHRSTMRSRQPRAAAGPGSPGSHRAAA